MTSLGAPPNQWNSFTFGATVEIKTSGVRSRRSSSSISESQKSGTETQPSAITPLRRIHPGHDSRRKLLQPTLVGNFAATDSCRHHQATDSHRSSFRHPTLVGIFSQTTLVATCRTTRSILVAVVYESTIPGPTSEQNARQHCGFVY